MAFTALSSRIAAAPDVLVGPILRLVLADEVSVFLVLKTPAKVTLEVFASELGGTGTNRQMVGTRSTVPLGTSFHVVCVTATGPAALTPGDQYLYDVRFGAHGNDAAEAPAGRRLFSDDVVREDGDAARALLTYPQGPALPSFVLPPADVSELRLLHASCRKPHGPGRDAMAVGDEIVAGSFTSLDARPHQLFLGGDQIYADDVAIGLLFLLQDAAAALGFPVERLPLKAGEKTGAQLPPGSRAEPLGEADAAFTSGHLDAHLMTFADYALMYAFAWSDVLWPEAVDLPGFAEALPAEFAEYSEDEEDAPTAFTDEPPNRSRHGRMAKRIAEEMDYVRLFREGLAQVRRLLANVPSLMIFDDHEVTDDWNLNLDWIKRTQEPLPPQGTPTKLGRAVLRNGLAGFAVFQAWGNTPAQFRAGQPGDPGTKLLTALAAWDGRAAGAEVTQMQTCVGLPTGFNARVAVRAAGAIDWHYRHRWASHEAIVLDTRTRRGARTPADAGGAPALICETEDFDAMIPRGAPPGADDLTVVVAPAPVFGVPLHEAAARHVKAPWAKIDEGSDPEHWALTPYAREHFLSALLSRPARGGDGVVRARAVVLSGDVHHGSALRVRYHATKPFRYAGTGPVEGVVAQLTSSALKNQSFLTLTIEKLGFYTINEQGLEIGWGALPLTQVNGWENAGGAKRVIGRKTPAAGSTVLNKIKVRGEPGLHEQTYPVPTSNPGAAPVVVMYTLTAAPDWHYEVRPQPGVLVGRGTATALAASATSRVEKVQRAVAAAQQHHRYSVDLGVGQKVVGHNNIGDVSFAWGAGDDKVVIQNLWWRPEDHLDAAPLTRWEIRLDNGST